MVFQRIPLTVSVILLKLVLFYYGVSSKICFLFSLSVYGPLLRLSPPPCEKDYLFNLGEGEGVCDLFDVQMLSL